MTHGGDSYCVVWVESLCVGFGVGHVNVNLNARGGLWLTRVALARCGGSRWAQRFGAMRQWERGWERGVSVCLFVTFCHCSKYAFIVVRCQRLGGVGFLLTALLGFCETVFGPFGRHTCRLLMSGGSQTLSVYQKLLVLGVDAVVAVAGKTNVFRLSNYKLSDPR